jgi:hypothetical protein
MNKSLWCGALVTSIVAVWPSAAHADELAHDMCFSMTGNLEADLSCAKMKTKFDSVIDDMMKDVDRDLLKGMSKKKKKEYLASHGKEWLVALVGMRDEARSECTPIAQDEGTWYIYKRDRGDNYTEEKRSTREKSGLLGALVTPVQQMVCLDWKIPLQALVEQTLSKKIAAKFFEYRLLGNFKLDELQIRTE